MTWQGPLIGSPLILSEKSGQTSGKLLYASKYELTA